MGASWRPSADGDEDALDDVVSHPLVVPRCLERLHVAGSVGRTAGEFMLARGRVPVERPAAPREFADGRYERRVCPLAIRGELHPLDLAVA